MTIGPVIAHGVDIIEVARIERMLQAHPVRFPRRCFTEAERDYAEQPGRSAERFAARFAAKEAVLKALGTGWRGGLQWSEIEVIRGDLGQPSLRLHGACADLAAGRGIGTWHLSLSHTSALAVASVIGCS